jgi:hypothetical protein
MKLWLIKRKIKLIYQKLTRGFGDDDTWSLDHTAAEWLLPRIKRFREITCAFPSSLDTFDDWAEILDTIIYALEEHLKDEWLVGLSEEERTKVDLGFEYLGKYFRGLWY